MVTNTIKKIKWKVGRKEGKGRMSWIFAGRALQQDQRS